MKTIKTISRFTFYIFISAVCIHIIGGEALASENGGGWRPIYDTVMKWVNFGILAFLIVKYGKKPLMDFLHGKKEELAKEIGQLEDEKEKYEVNLKETLDLVEKGDDRIDEIKKRIEDQGKKEKEKIIQDAKKQSVLMIEESKKKAAHQLVQAKEKFRSELVDMAVTLATERLPGIVTVEDQENLINKYLATAQQ